MCINTETHHAKPNHEYSPLQLEHLDPVHPIRNKSMTHCGIKTDLQFSDPEWYFCSAEWPQLQLRVAIAEFQPSCKYTFVRFSESVSLTVWGLIKVPAIVQCSGVFGWSAVLTACLSGLVIWGKEQGRWLAGGGTWWSRSWEPGGRKKPTTWPMWGVEEGWEAAGYFNMYWTLSGQPPILKFILNKYKLMHWKTSSQKLGRCASCQVRSVRKSLGWVSYGLNKFGPKILRKLKKNWENWRKNKRIEEEEKTDKVEEKLRKSRRKWESWRKTEKVE